MNDTGTDTTGTDTWHPTACVLCSINCGLEVRVDGPTIIRVRGDKAPPARRATPARRVCASITTRTARPG